MTSAVDNNHIKMDGRNDLQIDATNISVLRHSTSCDSFSAPVTDISQKSFGISLPDDPSRRWAVTLFSLTTILLYADQNLLGPNLTAISNEFGFTDEERDRKLGGDIAVAFFLLGAPASLVVGCLADTSHRSRLLAIVVGIGEGACFLTYFSTTYTELYIYRAITGFSLGGAVPLIYSVLGDLFSSTERHAVNAMVGIGTGLGISLGQGLAGFLGPTFGWRFPFLVVSVPALLFALLVLLTVKDPARGSMEQAAVEHHHSSQVELTSHVALLPKGNDEIVQDSFLLDDAVAAFTAVKQSSLTLSADYDQEEEKDECSGYSPDSTYHQRVLVRSNERVHWNTFVYLMSMPSVVLCLLQGAPGCVPWGIINTYLNDYLSEDCGMTVEGATATLLCFGIGNFFGLIVGGAGGQALCRINPRYPTLLAGSGAIIACFPIWLVLNTIHVTSSSLYIVIITGFAGLCAGITGPIVKANLQNVTLPTARGQAFAIYNMFDDFGRGLGPFFISIMISNLGGRLQAFNIGILGWFLCGVFNLITFFTIGKDEYEMQRTLRANLNGLDAEI